MPVRGLPVELSSAHEELRRIAARAGDKETPVPVPQAHRETAKALWVLGLLSLNASQDCDGEYFSQAVLTPLADAASVLVMPASPVGDISAKVHVVSADGAALLLVASAGADLWSLPSRRSPRTRFEVRHVGVTSEDHNLYSVHARLDLVAVEIMRLDRWGTELEGVIVDAALSPPAAAPKPCECDLDDEPHQVVSETEPTQSDNDVALVGTRVRITLTPVKGSL